MPGTGQHLKGGVYARQRGPSPLTAGPPALTTHPHSQGSSSFAGGGPSSLPASGRRPKATQHNTTEGGRDDDGNDGNRNEDDEDGGGERAEGCGKAARAHHEGACGEDGRECGLPVGAFDGAYAVDSEDAGEGRGGLGRGPRPGDRLPPGRRGDRGEQLHQGARTHPGHDHAGPGRPR